MFHLFQACISSFFSTENNQLEDPRQQWHAEQQLMLRDYLQRNGRDIEVCYILHHHQLHKYAIFLVCLTKEVI